MKRRGYSVTDAVMEAGRRRLRPILMTSMTTILALIPLALGIGEGADAQAPLARAVVGGLTASTLITLVLIPVVFSLVHSDKDKVVTMSSPTEKKLIRKANLLVESFLFFIWLQQS